MKRIGITACLGCAALLSGCGALINLSNPPDITFFPDTPNQVIRSGDVVSVSFGGDVNRNSVEEIFAVAEATGGVPGRYVWSDHRLSFHPEEPYLPGRRYVVSLKGSFEGADGTRHEVYRSVPFFFGVGEGQPPAVAGITPPAGSSLALEEEIAFQFTSPVDAASLTQGILLSPNERVIREIDASDTTGRTVIVRPETRWQSFTRYSLTVTKSLTDRSGRPISREFTAGFLAQADVVPPDLVVIESTVRDCETVPPYSGPGIDVATSGHFLHPTEVLRFRFSEAMDRESAEAAVTMMPAVAGEYVWPREDTLVFVPYDDLRSGMRHTVLVESRATDTAGLPLSNPVAQPVLVSAAHMEVSVELVDDGLSIGASEQQTPVTIHPGHSPGYSYSICFGFSESFDSDSDKLETRRRIRLAPLLANGVSAPYAESFGWSSHRNLCITYGNVTPSTSNGKNYLLLSIPGGEHGIRSSGGRGLTDDFRVLLLPEAR